MGVNVMEITENIKWWAILEHAADNTRRAWETLRQFSKPSQETEAERESERERKSQNQMLNRMEGMRIFFWIYYNPARYDLFPIITHMTLNVWVWVWVCVSRAIEYSSGVLCIPDRTTSTRLLYGATRAAAAVVVAASIVCMCDEAHLYK